MKSALRWQLAVVGVLASTGVLNYIVYTTATGSAVPLLESQPYERGLNYDATLAQLNRAAASGLTPIISTEFVAGQPRLCVAFGNGASTEVGDRIHFSALRFSGDVPDVAGELHRELGGASRYCGALALPAKGLWRVDLLVSVKGDSALYRVLHSVS